jgi:hypothetical protein
MVGGVARANALSAATGKQQWRTPNVARGVCFPGGRRVFDNCATEHLSFNVAANNCSNNVRHRAYGRADRRWHRVGAASSCSHRHGTYDVACIANTYRAKCLGNCG